MKKIYLLIILIVFSSCKKEKEYRPSTLESSYNISDSNYDVETNEDSDANSDGTYCADVEYYNPNTGTRHTYELDVEVEDGYLVQIDWPNGGWLDETHFSSEDITSGECSFTSDRGYQYTVTLGEKGGGCYGEGNKIRSDINEDTENITSPKFGDEKYEYEEYCYSCKRKIEEEKEQQAEQERIDSEEEE